MTFLSVLKEAFFPKPKTTKQTLDELSTGDIVRLRYKDPREIGILNPNQSAFIRFNPNEMINRVIKGTVTKLWFEQPPLNTRLIEITLVKDQGNIRKMLFMEEEIESVERL